jgi:hypothetical protein
VEFSEIPRNDFENRRKFRAQLLQILREFHACIFQPTKGKEQLKND